MRTNDLKRIIELFNIVTKERESACGVRFWRWQRDVIATAISGAMMAQCAFKLTKDPSEIFIASGEEGFIRLSALEHLKALYKTVRKEKYFNMNDLVPYITINDKFPSTSDYVDSVRDQPKIASIAINAEQFIKLYKAMKPLDVDKKKQPIVRLEFINNTDAVTMRNAEGSIGLIMPIDVDEIPTP